MHVNAGSAYVALVAPRVVQAGTVRVDGSAAYVAAEQANIRINGGLFDIDVTVGAEGGNVITHTGTTTGTAHQQGDADQSRIYLVAIPKNDAVTMLVSGAIGYDDAAAAQVEPDGAVRLSAGYNIVGGELAAAPANATAANITAGDSLFRSNTIARASGAFVATPTQTVPGAPPPLSSAGLFSVEGAAPRRHQRNAEYRGRSAGRRYRKLDGAIGRCRRNARQRRGQCFRWHADRNRRANDTGFGHRGHPDRRQPGRDRTPDDHGRFGHRFGRHRRSERHRRLGTNGSGGNGTGGTAEILINADATSTISLRRLAPVRSAAAAMRAAAKTRAAATHRAVRRP